MSQTRVPPFSWERNKNASFSRASLTRHAVSRAAFAGGISLSFRTMTGIRCWFEPLVQPFHYQPRTEWEAGEWKCLADPEGGEVISHFMGLLQLSKASLSKSSFATSAGRFDSQNPASECGVRGRSRAGHLPGCEELSLSNTQAKTHSWLRGLAVLCYT